MGIAVSSWTAASVTIPFGQADTWETVGKLAFEEAARRGHVICPEPGYGLQCDGLHQYDSGIMGGSHAYDQLCAQSIDWSKLPDWPAWSKLMAAEPL